MTKRKEKNPIVAGFPPEAKKDQLVSLDIEMFDQTKTHRPTGSFALISVKLQGDDTVYQLYDEKDLRRLFRIVDKGTWVLANAVYDLRQFRRYAPIAPRYIHDVILMEQALRGGLYQTYGLADLSRRWLGEPMEKETREQFFQKRDISPEMKRYAAQDVIATERIALLQLETYSTEFGFRAYTHADEPMIFPVLDVGGMRVDVEGWRKMAEEFECLGRQIEEELGFNVKSTQQVLKALEKKEKLHLKSTDAKVLEEYKDRPLVAAILEARMYRDASSKYGVKWLENVEEDGKVYSDYHITGATMTGRMSSSNPNLQNIPQRKMPQYRERFLASPGHVMGVWDVHQQEPSITAFHSQDRALIEAIKNGEDLHLAVARAIYDNPNLTKADKMERSHGKAINLGLTYGLTANGLSQRTGMTVEEADAMIRKYFLRYSGVRSYIIRQRQKAERDGFVTTALGRRSYINPYDRKWENNAINSPIQGGAADFTKMWVRKVWEKTRAAGLPYAVVAFVHDEIVFDTPKEAVRDTRPLIEEAFRETAEYLYRGIPMKVEAEFGRTWGAKSIEADRISLDEEE